MAFDANARIALPEFVYINLDICQNKTSQQFQSWREVNQRNLARMKVSNNYFNYQHR